MVSRRGFLKLVTAWGASLALPASVIASGPESGAVTLVLYEIDEDAIGRAMTLGAPVRGLDGQGSVPVTLDMAALWQAVRLEDDRGRSWYTLDGSHWTHGPLSFDVELGNDDDAD